MIAAPAARAIQSSAERPAPKTAPEVWLRDAGGDGARRIPRVLADRLVLDGIAERVSAGGHVRLKLGIRSLPYPCIESALHAAKQPPRGAIQPVVYNNRRPATGQVGSFRSRQIGPGHTAPAA